MIHEVRRQNAHEARQDDDFGVIRVNHLHHGVFKGFARVERLVIDDVGGNAERLGFFQACGVGAVAHDSGNRDTIRSPIFFSGDFGDGGEVGAAAGNENNDVFHNLRRANSYGRPHCSGSGYQQCGSSR